MGTIKKSLFVGAASIVLTACGGGGSSGGGTGGTPGGGSGGNTNSAPVISIQLSSASGNEGTEITIDASGTTDADGDTLSFTWSQISGPTVDLANAGNQNTITITLPDVNSDSEVVIGLSVSDGTASASQNSTIQVLDTSQSPTVGFTFTKVQDVTTSTRPEHLYMHGSDGIAFSWDALFFTKSPDQAGQLGVTYLEDTGTGGFIETSAVPISREFDRPAALTMNEGGRIGHRFEDSFSSFGVIAESENLVEFYNLEPIGRGATLLSVDIDSPCALASDTFNGIPDPFARLYIGQRNGGLSIIRFDRDPNDGSPVPIIDQNFGATSSNCAIAQASIPLDSSSFSTEPFSPHIITVDVDAKTATVYLSRFTTQWEFVEGSTVNLDLGSNSANLEFIDYDVIGSLNEPSRGLVAIFSDKQNDGDHKLVVLGLNADAEIIQQIHSWPLGVPTDVNYHFVGGSDPDHLVITTPDMPEAVVFQKSPDFPLTGPSFMPVGRGASSYQFFASEGIVYMAFSYPDENRIGLFEFTEQ